MIAIIPVAGIGSKLRPHTYTQPKSLIPIAGKPILGYIIDQLMQNKITEFVFVIGYLGEKVKEYVETQYPKLNAKFVVQEEREGLGQAVWLTKNHIPKKREVIIVLGDAIIELDWKKFLSMKSSAIAVKKVNDPRKFGVAEFDDKGFITKTVEKPAIPKSNMAVVGIYKIKEFNVLIQCLESNIKEQKRSNGQYTLTDGIQGMLEKGIQIAGFKVENWYDCGQKEILLETNRLMLNKQSKVAYNKKNLQNSIIVEPVYLGKNAILKDSIIGPNVTIGENAIVQNSIIRDSIIGSYTRLNEVILHQSLIGNDSEIWGSTQSLNIGDNTELDLR
jgi:glucose-1-phosphate thymidylyltransferase